MKYFLNEREIGEQREKVLASNPEIELVSACTVDNGILRLKQFEREHFRTVFNQDEKQVCFFIPASGSGSRMFQFLHEFISNPNETNSGQVEQFLNSIESFAFFYSLPDDIQKEYLAGKFDLEEFIVYLLYDNGMNYAHLPKGLFPFHQIQGEILNPFQAHIVEGTSFQKMRARFHFTINKNFSDSISLAVEKTRGLIPTEFNYHFDEQHASTNSIAFYENGEMVFDAISGEPISRPSGHGALLPILNSVDEELIFVKNIDNIQHFNRSRLSIETWEMLGGMLLEFKREAKVVNKNPTIEGLHGLNKKYQLFSDVEMDAVKSEDSIRSLLNRPTRVAGMVKNIGQPGGGPFWVKEKGRVVKQIVEKSQISNCGKQLQLMVQSTHFNPVMLALSTYDLEGQKIDLNDHIDQSKYFIVQKPHLGTQVKYIERPGLWNGSMSDWNTIFVEIPSGVFSPVKTVLDLLSDSHQA